MDADNHALVHWVIGPHEHAASVIELTERVGEDLTFIHRDQHPILAAANLALKGFVAVKNIGNQSRTTCQIQEFIGKANQTACWNAVFQANTAPTVRLHIHQVALALAKRLHHTALVLVFNIDRDHFDRLMLFPIDQFVNHTGFGHGQFIAFAPHVFQQYR